MKRLCVLLGLLAGCGTSDPLQPGVKCIVVDTDLARQVGMVGRHVQIEGPSALGDDWIEVIPIDGEGAGRIEKIKRSALRPL
jgi:hypothetical protein